MPFRCFPDCAGPANHRYRLWERGRGCAQWCAVMVRCGEGQGDSDALRGPGGQGYGGGSGWARSGGFRSPRVVALTEGGVEPRGTPRLPASGAPIRDHCRWWAQSRTAGLRRRRGLPSRGRVPWGGPKRTQSARTGDIGQTGYGGENRREGFESALLQPGPGPSSTPSWRGARRWTSVRGGGVRFRRNAEG